MTLSRWAHFANWIRVRYGLSEDEAFDRCSPVLEWANTNEYDNEDNERLLSVYENATNTNLAVRAMI